MDILVWRKRATRCEELRIKSACNMLILYTGVVGQSLGSLGDASRLTFLVWGEGIAELALQPIFRHFPHIRDSPPSQPPHSRRPY